MLCYFLCSKTTTMCANLNNNTFPSAIYTHGQSLWYSENKTWKGVGKCIPSGSKVSFGCIEQQLSTWHIDLKCTTGHGWGIFCGLGINWYVLQSFPVLHSLWHAKHISMLVENNHLVWFEYTDFHIFNSPFHYQPGVLANVGRVHICQKRPVATPRWGDNGPDAPQHEEYISSDFQYYSSKIL